MNKTRNESHACQNIVDACTDTLALVPDPIREEINRIRQSAQTDMAHKKRVEKQDRFIAISVQDEEEKSPTLFDSPTSRSSIKLSKINLKTSALIQEESKRAEL